MKATYTNKTPSFNPAHRKNDLFQSYVVIDADFNHVLTCRLYQPGTVCYAAIWLHGGGYNQGTGTAGGGGYHKPSAAVEQAIVNAGIALDEPVGGRGDQALEAALIAVARLVTSKRKLAVIKAHA